MQNLLLHSKKGNIQVISRLFATIKNLGVDIKPTDTLVNSLLYLVK